MWFVQNDWCVYGMTEVQDGDAKKENLKEKIEKKLNRKFIGLFTGQQVHGTKVTIVSSGTAEWIPQNDGLLSEMTGALLGVYTADCLPVILKEDKRKVIGALHAGWRGTMGGILKEALATLKKEWQIEPNQVNFFLGPHIRSCCYQVGKEVAKHFPQETLLQRNEKNYLDLERALKSQLQQCGGDPKQISSDPSCTCCNQNFFSFRRDKTEKRMLAFIAKLN